MSTAAEPKVFIGQPVYLGAHPQAIMCAKDYATRVSGRAAYVPMESAFHCANFNALWCAALNSREGNGWTHVAMIHQDVHAVRWWLDKALEVMDRADVDLLSVVLPLKDDKGMTSTAVLDKWKLATRRLAMKEVHRYLPETFTSADLAELGHENSLLLASGGLQLYRVGDWMEKVWWEAPTKIVRDQSGQFVSAVWDEGWNLSLQMYQLGLKIACTREIHANHLGGGVWGNEESWGEWDTDCGETSQEWILGRTP